MQSDAKACRAKVVPIKAEGGQERAKLARLPAPVHSVQEKGKQQFSRALRSLFDNADDALFALADKATNNQEQNLYFESMREVRIRRRDLESKFAGAVEKAFADLVGKERPSDVYGNRPVSVNNLSLVEDDELEELVAVDSMIAKANKNCGESLQYLSLRLDSLVPNKVYQKTNPLGPDIICNAFVAAARELDADIKAKLVLLKLFDQYVVSQLPEIYEILNRTLIEHGVLPSLQHKDNRPQNSTPAGQAAAPPPQSAASGPATSSSTASGPSIAGGAASNGGMAAQASNGSLSANDLLGALTQIQGEQSAHSGASSRGVAGAQTDISGLLLQVLEEQHGKRALAQSQTETINLVKLLFEFILDDRSLAEPMKALIGRLQIPILKVALLDDSFFKKTGHSARRLLNEMATASLGWQENPKDEGHPKDPLYRKISDTVQTLLGEFESDLSLFNDVLADFVSFIDKERKRALILEQRTIDAEDGKAKAEAARREVNEALSEVLGGRSLPVDAQKILDEAWSNVLFLICLKQGKRSEEWQQALQTAEDLIWSVTIDSSSESRQQLLGMIPHLVKRLREGLERISFNPFEMTQLLNRLEKLHLARLQQAAAQVQGAPVKAPVAKSDLPASAPTKAPQAEEQPVNPSIEAKAEATEEPLDHSAFNDNTAEDAAAIDSSYLALISKLTQGTWFEMIEGNGKSYRCRLAAIIKPTGKYIFVNRSGMKVAEKTKEGLALAMKEDKLRLLDDTMLFDRALESVISNLRKP